MMTKDSFLAGQRAMKCALPAVQMSWAWWVTFGAGASLCLASGFCLNELDDGTARGPVLLILGLSLMTAVITAIGFRQKRITGKPGFSCPHCSASLTGLPLRWLAIASDHCGNCGGRLWDEATIMPLAPLPSKTELINRRIAAKRQLDRLGRAQALFLFALLLLMICDLGRWRGHDPGPFNLGVMWVGIVMALAWPILKSRQIVSANELLCPGCRKPLPPDSSCTSGFPAVVGSVAAITGACGYCGTQTYQPSSLESPAPVALPPREEFLACVRVYRRKARVVAIIWFVGLMASMVVPRMVLGWNFGEASAGERAIIAGLMFASIMFYLGATIVVSKLWGSVSVTQMLCPSCAKPVASAIGIATGKCGNCGSRVYAREE